MKLIDVDMLCKYCDNNINHSITPNEIMRMPLVDAEPVKHGHWIEKKNRITCSNCGREVLYNSDYLPQTTHFCYNCGAKMNNGKDFEFNNSLLRSWK